MHVENECTHVGTGRTSKVGTVYALNNAHPLSADLRKPFLWLICRVLPSMLLIESTNAKLMKSNAKLSPRFNFWKLHFYYPSPWTNKLFSQDFMTLHCPMVNEHIEDTAVSPVYGNQLFANWF